MSDQVPVVQVAEYIEASPSQVWECLTQPKHMKQWFFEQMPDFRAESGFQTRFRMKSDTREFHTTWKVLQVERGKKLVVAWTYKDIPGLGEVSYILRPAGKGTQFEIRNEGLGSFPQDIPEFHYESCRGGWLYFMERLRNYILEKNPLPGK